MRKKKMRTFLLRMDGRSAYGRSGSPSDFARSLASGFAGPDRPSATREGVPIVAPRRAVPRICQTDRQPTLPARVAVDQLKLMRQPSPPNFGTGKQIFFFRTVGAAGSIQVFGSDRCRQAAQRSLPGHLLRRQLCRQLRSLPVTRPKKPVGPSRRLHHAAEAGHLREAENCKLIIHSWLCTSQSCFANLWRYLNLSARRGRRLRSCGLLTRRFNCSS